MPSPPRLRSPHLRLSTQTHAPLQNWEHHTKLVHSSNCKPGYCVPVNSTPPKHLLPVVFFEEVLWSLLMSFSFPASSWAVWSWGTHCVDGVPGVTFALLLITLLHCVSFVKTYDQCVVNVSIEHRREVCTFCNIAAHTIFVCPPIYGMTIDLVAFQEMLLSLAGCNYCQCSQESLQ